MPYQRMTRPELMLEKLILLNEHSWEDESDLKLRLYALGFLVNHEPDKSREIAKNIWNQTPSVSEAPEPFWDLRPNLFSVADPIHLKDIRRNRGKTYEEVKYLVKSPLSPVQVEQQGALAVDSRQGIIWIKRV